MTRQNNNTEKIGAIRIGGGFTGKLKLRRHEYPPDRLTEFLQLDTDNEKKVAEFRSNYQLVLYHPDPQETLAIIKAQQANLKRIAAILFNNQLLTSEDIELINRELAKIHPAVSYPARTDTGIQNTPKAIREQMEPRHLILSQRHVDTFASLWHDLIIHFVTKQDIKQCINCGDFFINSLRHKTLYCSGNCANALKKARHRHKVKK